MKTLILSLALFFLPVFVQAQTQSAQLGLTWTDTNENETGFKIERRLGQTGEFVEVAQMGPNSTQFYDSFTDDPGETEYCYRLRAFNDAGDSPYSPVVCAKTSPLLLPPADAPAVSVTVTVVVR